MPVTTLDPRTALLVIDLQAGLADAPTVHPLPEVVARTATLLEAFRARGLPVVLVNAEGNAPGRTDLPRRPGRIPAAATELLPELDRQPRDKVVTKHTWGAFQDTDLAGHLAGLGVTQVVIAGIATSMGVESTARQAHERGLHVVLATDAMTDLDPATHENSIRRIFPRIGETGTAREIARLLAHGPADAD